MFYPKTPYFRIYSKHSIAVCAAFLCLSFTNKTATAQSLEQENFPFSPSGSSLAAQVDSLEANKQYFQYGRELEETGNIEEAYSAYRKAYHLNPEDFRSVYRAGRILYELDKLPNARAALRRSVSIEESFYPAQNLLSIVLMKEGDLDEALRAGQKAVQAAPTFAPAWRNLAALFVDMENYPEALQALKRAVSLDPTHVESRVTYGLLLAQNRQLPEAEIALTEAVAINPLHNRANQGLAWVRQWLQQPLVRNEGAPEPREKARGFLDDTRAEEVWASDAPIETTRALRAPAWAFSTPEARFGDPRGFKRRGYAMVQGGNYQKGAELLEQAGKLGERDDEMFATLGYAFFHMDQYHNAAEAYANAQRFAPVKQPWYDVNRGLVLHKAGKLSEAAHAFGDAIRIEHDFARAHYLLGLVRLEQGRNRRAVRALRKATELDHTNSRAYQALAVSYLRRGKGDKAIESYQNALAIEPQNPDLMFSVARLLEADGRMNDAITLYADFAALTEGNGDYSDWNEYAAMQTERHALRQMSLPEKKETPIDTSDQR